MRQSGATSRIDRNHAGGTDLVDHDEPDLPQHLAVVRTGGLTDAERFGQVADPHRPRGEVDRVWSSCTRVGSASRANHSAKCSAFVRSRLSAAGPEMVMAEEYLASIDLGRYCFSIDVRRCKTTEEFEMQLPVIIIGAGPIGLAAAANAAERDMDFIVVEAGGDAGAAVGEWGHVRLFSSWLELIDPAARRLLEATGTWTAPDDSDYPTGSEWREAYLQPLANLLNSSTNGSVHYNTQVTGVSRAGRDLLVDSGRENDPFAVHVHGPEGHQRLLGSAVVDASGTWTSPNPLGADGYPARGEREHADRISYGIPDFTDTAVAARYAGKHVAVAGKGASAKVC